MWAAEENRRHIISNNLFQGKRGRGGGFARVTI